MFVFLFCCVDRPAAEKKEGSQCSMCPREVHGGQGLSRTQFLEKLQASAASTRREHVEIRAVKNEWRRKSTSFYYTFRCCACVDCGWSGVATYNGNTKEVVFRLHGQGGQEGSPDLKCEEFDREFHARARWPCAASHAGMVAELRCPFVGPISSKHAGRNR